jgi:DNA-binding XRE family transcriptional regulator
MEVSAVTDEEKLQKYLPLIRNAAGWTAEELGNKIGVTKQTISNLETMKTKMSKTQYLAIQMVISQKIATSQNDMTLANVMKLVMGMEEEQTINYDAIPEAMAVVEEVDEETGNTGIAEPDQKSGTKKLAGALALLGLASTGAISAAILGATISPWLTKALGDNDKEDKEKEERVSGTAK